MLHLQFTLRFSKSFTVHCNSLLSVRDCYQKYFKTLAVVILGNSFIALDGSELV